MQIGDSEGPGRAYFPTPGAAGNHLVIPNQYRLVGSPHCELKLYLPDSSSQPRQAWFFRSRSHLRGHKSLRNEYAERPRALPPAIHPHAGRRQSNL